MEERYKVTENSQPLYKAYNIAEKCDMTYDERMNQWEGPVRPERTNSMYSNSFFEYKQSGGISKNDGERHRSNSIAMKLAEAKTIKGTLHLNNAQPNGGSWKTPKLDLALQSKSGFKGGETGQRFYSKFPIYRPRGTGPPDVNDNIFNEWNK